MIRSTDFKVMGFNVGDAFSANIQRSLAAKVHV